MADPRRVFISYSDDSPEHAGRVLELAQWLRTRGIDACVDQFEDSPEEGWPRWIYRQIRESDFVLVICTPAYLARCEADVPRSGGSDKAVKFESHLSLQEIHDADGRNRKFVPVLFDEADVGECVPLPLRAATHYRLPEQRDDLYRRLSDQPKVRAAPLGPLKREDGLELVLTPSERLDAAATVQAGRRSSNGKRMLAVAAFGVAFVAVALMLGRERTSESPSTSPTCSVQLIEPGGGTVDGIDAVRLELAAGQRIAVTIDNGDTLTFDCPEVEVRARVVVERFEESHAERTIDSEILISPEPGLQRIPLAIPDESKPEPPESPLDMERDADSNTEAGEPTSPADAKEEPKVLMKKKGPRGGDASGQRTRIQLHTDESGTP